MLSIIIRLTSSALIIIGVTIPALFSSQPVIYIAPDTLVLASTVSHETTYTPQEIDGLIRRYASEYNADLTLALNIAWVESQMDYDAKNPNSTAKGVYQFLDSTWAKYCTGDPLNPHDNIKCAMDLQTQRQYGHWIESYDMEGKGWRYLPYKS